MIVLKVIGGPGSIGFLILCCGIGSFVSRVWPRRRWYGRAWMLVVFSLYVFLGTPIIASDISDALTSFQPVADLQGLKPADTVVLFGGDNIRGRVREALRAHAAWPEARVVVFDGDWPLLRLLEGGIPPGQILHDPRPANTLEQMEAVREYLREHTGARAALIASRLQMPRVAALADTMGMQVELLPSLADDEPPRTGVARWVPRYIALRLSRDAIYEHAAIWYYRWKGFTRS